MVVCEEYLFYGLEARNPRIRINKAEEMKVEDVRTIIADDPGNTFPRFESAICCWHKRRPKRLAGPEASHFFSWFRLKTQHTLPATLSKLQ